MEQKEFFEITSVSRADLESKGFDTSQITDEQMKELASRMANDYCEQLFWESMTIIAEIMGLPRITAIKSVALKLMKAIVYGNDFVNRLNPEDPKLYEPYMDKVVASLEKPFAKLGEDFFDDDFVDLITSGECGEVSQLLRDNPSLSDLDSILDDYLDYLKNA